MRRTPPQQLPPISVQPPGMTDTAGSSRILTLVFTDLVDSTALKMLRGDQAVGELIARHREHVRRLTAESGGRIIDWAGDGCFLTFETPSAAVLFALRLQRVHAEEPDLPGVRTGIHMGEVSEQSGPDGDVAHPRVEGLAVDLAARISGLARPAQVLMSSGVADSARQRLNSHVFDQPVRWRAHGSYALKGFDEPLEIREAGFEGIAPFEAPAASEKATPPRPPGSMTKGKTPRVVAIATVCGAAIAGLVWWTTSQPRGPHPPAAPRPDAVSPPANKSIAVLPFVNMSPDASDEYLSDGMTEELITALSKIGGIHVAARTSSFAFKGKNQEIETIGQQLHVGTVLEGSVRKDGKRMRIAAQLINVTDGYHLWSETYEEDLADLFTVQAKVAQRVAQALKIELGIGDKQRLAERATENSEAHELYLKGQYYTGRFTRAGMEKGKDYFQQAIDLDPNYAPAYLGLAYYYFARSDYASPPRDAMPKAAGAARKALEIDPGLTDAHGYLGWVHFAYEWNWAAAEAEFQRAIEQRPDNVIGHELYGAFLANTGRWREATAEGRRAVELDPLSPEANSMLGGLLITHDVHAAISQLQRTTELDPRYWWARVLLARAYVRAGRFEEGIAEARLAQGIENDTEVSGVLGWALARAGRHDEAAKVADALIERSRREYVSPYFIAMVYAGIPEADRAFEWLDRAYAGRSSLLVSQSANADLDLLHSDPRFAELMKKMGSKP